MTVAQEEQRYVVVRQTISTMHLWFLAKQGWTKKRSKAWTFDTPERAEHMAEILRRDFNRDRQLALVYVGQAE